MGNEHSHEETQDLFETLKGFIDTLKESNNSESQVSGILTLLNSILELLEADRNVSSSQSVLLQNLNDSFQTNVKVLIEYDERITKLNDLITDLASNSSKLGQVVMNIAETAAKIPVVNVDNLLETLNEHAKEINENTAAIKAINERV